MSNISGLTRTERRSPPLRHGVSSFRLSVSLFKMEKFDSRSVVLESLSSFSSLFCLRHHRFLTFPQTRMTIASVSFPKLLHLFIHRSHQLAPKTAFKMCLRHPPTTPPAPVSSPRLFKDDLNCFGFVFLDFCLLFPRL